MTRDTRRLLQLGAVVAVVALWSVTLRPVTLGGPAMYIVVRGSSMQPTYQSGDLVVVESAGAYAIGDVVAYRVPSGEIGEGHVVVHRIASGDEATGFVVRGDNNDAPDPWSPRNGDIAGRAWLMLPGIGRLIAFVHQPVVAGALAACVVVSLVLARPSHPARRQRASADGDPIAARAA